MSGYRAAGARNPRRRPLRAEPPLADIPVGEWEAHCDDVREAALLEEQRQDRLDDHAGRPWPNAAVVAFPARDDVQRKAAA